MSDEGIVSLLEGCAVEMRLMSTSVRCWEMGDVKIVYNLTTAIPRSPTQFSRWIILKRGINQYVTIEGILEFLAPFTSSLARIVFGKLDE